MLIYKQCNLFDEIENHSEPIIIPHVCNNHYVMGAGFALAAKKLYPQVYNQYKDERPAIGTTQFIKIKDNIWFANMVAQRGLISYNNPIPIDYVSLCSCMHQVENFRNSQYDTLPMIIAPKFGSGLAGGDWTEIEKMINDIWCNNVIICCQ